MFSTRKIRGSARKIVWLIFIGYFIGTIMVQTVVEFELNWKYSSYPPTRSAGIMLNRSQIILAKDIILEPTGSPCEYQSNRTAMYPLIIIVKTRAIASGENFIRRSFTRSSWAHEARTAGIPVFYAIGRNENSEVQPILEREHDQYGDLLQFNYIDSYYNVSIKSTGILHWFSSRNCRSQTQHLLVVDDDILINIPALLEIIRHGNLRNDTLYGFHLKDIEPHPSGKWAVSLADYTNETYPGFITGAFTLYPAEVVSRMVERIFSLADQGRQTFFLDDVMITGLIAEQLGVSRASMPGINECYYTDLFNSTIINECTHTRRVYVWIKFLIHRLGESTAAIDRLINTTVHLRWEGNFKHQRNGKPIAKPNQFEQTIQKISSFFYSSRYRLLTLAILVLIVFAFLPRFMNRQYKIDSSIESDSLESVASSKKPENKYLSK